MPHIKYFYSFVQLIKQKPYMLSCRYFSFSSALTEQEECFGAVLAASCSFSYVGLSLRVGKQAINPVIVEVTGASPLKPWHPQVCSISHGAHFQMLLSCNTKHSSNEYNWPGSFRKSIYSIWLVFYYETQADVCERMWSQGKFMVLAPGSSTASWSSC